MAGKRDFKFGLSQEMKNIQQKTVEMNKDKKLVWMDPKTLLDDEQNTELYGDFQNDVETLASSMKMDGFNEVIFAYKLGEQYKIRSGHRRKYAAIKAGVESVPVVLEPAPKSEYERMVRLLDSNNNKRDDKPMVMARTAAAYFELIQDRRRDDKEYAEKVKGIATKDLVADKMGKSAALVSRYQALTKLIPELQEKADDENFSWSALSSAGSLSPEKQLVINEIIDFMVEKEGHAFIKRDWLNKLIGDLKEGVFDTAEEYKCLTVRQEIVDVATANFEGALEDTEKLLESLKTEEESSAENTAEELPVEEGSSTAQKPTDRKTKKHTRAESIRNSAISLMSLLEDEDKMTEEEIKLVRSSLVGLRSAINKLVGEQW